MNKKEELTLETIKLLRENKYSLVEMARTKSQIIIDLDNRTDTVIESLICCILLKNNKAYKHWQGEVYGNLFRNYLWKNTNKYLSSKQLKEWYLLDWKINLKSQLKGYVDYIIDKENIKINNIDLNRIYEIVISYLEWLCDNLGGKSLLDKNETYKKIDKLINIY